MRINHVCIMVSDLDRSFAFYRDLLGFTNVMYDVSEPGTLFQGDTLDDILGHTGAATRIIMVASDDGTLLELQQASTPVTARTPDDYLRYGGTGITELAFDVDDIDTFFDKVVSFGYGVQTDYIWSPDPRVKSFLFYDPDGALIQAVGLTV
jgi:catechol 2,3-dioxygenase-like lactoylglutathione lyase family enzyme